MSRHMKCHYSAWQTGRCHARNATKRPAVWARRRRGVRAAAEARARVMQQHDEGVKRRTPWWRCGGGGGRTRQSHRCRVLPAADIQAELTGWLAGRPPPSPTRRPLNPDKTLPFPFFPLLLALLFLHLFPLPFLITLAMLAALHPGLPLSEPRICSPCMMLHDKLQHRAAHGKAKDTRYRLDPAGEGGARPAK